MDTDEENTSRHIKMSQKINSKEAQERTESKSDEKLFFVQGKTR